MQFQILRNDIAAMKVDAIVNTANPMPVIGEGVDAAIHQKAGPELLSARKQIGKLSPGQCAITPAFGLDARYVIHTVGPVWRGGLLGEGKLLRRCYEGALKLAEKHGCHSIAFPLISAGTYGFPKERALRIATTAISSFLRTGDMEVYLVVYDKESFRLSEDLFSRVQAYIDDNYIATKPLPPFSVNRREQYDRDMAPAEMRAPCAPAPCGYAPYSKSRTVKKTETLAELLEMTDAGFSETLLKLIDQTGLKDADVYKQANVTRQHFSKIRKDPFYKPTKATAIAFAIALKLDLDQTQDLIGRAGYALTRSSKFDVIIMYFIEQGIYDMMEINATLFEFDQSLLGA